MGSRDAEGGMPNTGRARAMDGERPKPNHAFRGGVYMVT